MASLVAKKKANQLYYYVVESARVDGKPRIVHQTYLGTAERVAALVKDRTAPVPVAATVEVKRPTGEAFGNRELTALLTLDGAELPRVKFKTDEKGRKVAVQIDLRKHRGLWEDFYDGLVSEQRRKEKGVPFEIVKADLIRRGRLRG